MQGEVALSEPGRGAQVQLVSLLAEQRLVHTLSDQRVCEQEVSALRPDEEMLHQPHTGVVRFVN